MVEFDFDVIRTVQRKERNVSSLVEIDPDFYKKLASFVKEQVNQYESAKDLGNIRLLGNTVKIARDISEKRLQKIVMKALKSAITGEPNEKNMTREEAGLYRKMYNVILEHKNFVEKVLTGEYDAGEVQGDSQKKEENKETIINKEDKKIVLARVTRLVPRFLANDGKEYGPFEANEIVKIPSEVADLLSSQNLVELL